jgi:3-oxoacyl-[acyl-carrier protein] reductase
MLMDSMSLRGQVAIVTGSRRGLGKAIALTLADVGADIAICDVVDDGVEMNDVAEKIKKLGRRSIAVQTDCTKKDQVENLVSRVENELGPVDILINNVGGGDTIKKTPFFVDISEEDWDTDFARNFKSCLLCTQAVSRGMIKRKTGKIVNIASVSAELGTASAYGCAKAAVLRFTKGAAFDLGKYNIRVNAIEPGVTPTGKPYLNIEERIARFKLMTPLRRVGMPEDIAKCALFLVSDASFNITGVIIPVDSGYMLGLMEHAPY